MKPTTFRAHYDESERSNCYIHDGAANLRFEIEGSLSGKAAMQLEQSWCTASSVIGNRSLVIALGDVSSIDPFGRALLLTWHEAGAQFVSKSPLAATLVSSIIGRPVMCATGDTRHENRARFSLYALPLFPLITLLFPAAVKAVSLDPATSKAWQEYIESASMRMEQRLSEGNAFLWVDERPDRLARVRSGEVVVSPVGPQNPKRVPSGLIHDWVGAAFIPGATLRRVLQVVRDYARYKESHKPGVIDCRVLATGGAKFFLKTALDSAYESCYVHLDDRRAYSVSRTTRIQEIEEYGAPGQRILHEGEGTGIIWRLSSITRFVERDGGVYLELEAIGLRLAIPAWLRWLVEPIVRRVSRGSLSRSLQHAVNAVLVHAEVASGKPGRGNAIALPASLHSSRSQNCRAI